MQIQINTDENIEGGQQLSSQISDEVRTHLDRFSKHITRIELHISDQDGGKSGGSDKRCLIEARLEGRQPQVVSEDAPTVDLAFSRATKKLQRALDSTLGKTHHSKGANSVRFGDE